MTGKNNIAIRFIKMGRLWITVSCLFTPRDFAPGKDEWVANYSSGKHIEARHAHVHGNLFAFLSILTG